MLPIKVCKQNGGQRVWSKCSLFVMAFTAKRNSQNYSKSRADCTETTSSLPSSQTFRFLLVFLFLPRYIFTQLPVRRVWTKPRAKLFWEETYARVGMNETGWRTSECPNKRLCVELSPHIVKRDTNFRKAITVRHRGAITLYWLADPAHCRMI